MFVFARRVWVSLGAGWAILAFGLTPYLRLDRAGAMLVCGAIVSEVLNEKNHRLFVDFARPGPRTRHTYREIDMLGEGGKAIEVTPDEITSGKFIINAELWTLYYLAKNSEFLPEPDGRIWHIETTMKRVERFIDYAIVVSAVIGTLAWAFGGPS